MRKAAANTFILALCVATCGGQPWAGYVGLALIAVAIILASEPEFLLRRLPKRVDVRPATEDHERG